MQAGFFAFNDKFILRKLIFINSAKQCFTEIDINHHLAVFGGNNRGKTSILNALKLFLFPEENLHKCERKFAFSNGNQGGYHNGIDSYNHYFTEDSSFIVLEAENRHGIFSQVLYRNKTSLGYARVLLPLAFEKIRYLFWNVNSELNSGLGEKISDLSLKNILDSLRLLGGIFIHTKKEIIQYLFQEHEYSAADGRFCILPFANNTNEKGINAFRNLFQLAYDIGGQDVHTLPKAVAAVLEGEKRHKREQLNVDFQNILEEEKVLRAERDYLTNCENLQQIWENLERSHAERIKQSQRAIQLYADFDYSLSAAEEMAAEQKAELEKTKQQLQNEKSEAERHAKQLQSAVDKQHGVVAILRQQWQASEDKLQRTAQIKQQYSALNLTEIADVLRQNKKEKEDLLASLSNQERAEADWQKAIRYCNHLSAEIKSIQQKLDENHQILPDFLSDRHSRDVLISLNQDFMTLDIQPDEQTQNKISAFTDLFANQEGQLSFLGLNLPNSKFTDYQREQQRASWTQQLAEKKNEWKIADNKARQLKQAMDIKANFTAIKNETQQSLDKLTQHLELLEDFDRNQKNNATLREQLEEAKQVLNEQQTHADAAQQAAENAAQIFAAHSEKIQKTDRQFADYPNLRRQLQQYLDFGQDAVKQKLSQIDADTVALNQDSLHKVQAAFTNYKALNTQCDNFLRQLLRADILPDVGEDVYLNVFEDSIFDAYYNKLRTIYANLEHSRQSLNNRIEAHAKESAIRTDEIKDAANELRNFQEEINQEFTCHHISNLCEIKIHFELDVTFRRLLDDLDKLQLVSTELQSRHFYDLLLSFSQKFFSNNEGRGRLNLEDIITEVKYSYRKQDSGKLIETSQSTGTNIMINSVLLATLLKRLMRPNTVLNLPLACDEVGKLDGFNLRELTNVAEKNGFFIFATNPMLTPQIANAVSHYFNLEYFTAEFPYHADNTVLYHGACERLLDSRVENI